MSQLHQRQRSEASLSDEWETPKALFEWLCAKYNFYPKLDVCATKENKKCSAYLTLDEKDREAFGHNGLYSSWFDKNWCNPPHSETELWVKQACDVFLNEDKQTMMIIPANSICAGYSEACIEPHAEYHPIFERPRFKQFGEQKDSARNSYFVVIWRRKN